MSARTCPSAQEGADSSHYCKTCHWVLGPAPLLRRAGDSVNRKSASGYQDPPCCPGRVQIAHPSRNSAREGSETTAEPQQICEIRNKNQNHSSQLHELWSYSSTGGILNSAPVEYPERKVFLQLVQIGR